MQEPSEKEENVVLRDALRGGQSAEMLSSFFLSQDINAFTKWKVAITLIHGRLLWTQIALLNLEIRQGYSEQLKFYRLRLKFWVFKHVLKFPFASLRPDITVCFYLSYRILA